MIVQLVAIALAAAAPVKLAAPGLTLVNLKPALAEFLNENLARELTDRGLDVVTPKQIAAVLGLQRQKELLGCAVDATSCAIELANALGVQALVLGELGQLGEQIQINLKIISPVDARLLAAWSGRVTGEGQLLDALADAARALAAQLDLALGRGSPLGATLRGWSWLPAAAGAVGVGAGIWLLVDASQQEQALRGTGDPLTRDQADAIYARGARNQQVGWFGVGIGAVALAAGAAMFLLADGGEVRASAAPLPGGAIVALSGRLP